MPHTSDTSRATFLLCSSPVGLAARTPHATVEAEYGDAVVEGSLLTMAHHGPRKGQKAPCAYTIEECAEALVAGPNEIVVGLSHLDLDSLGGCMAILGFKPGSAAFWSLAEFIDLNGAHKISAWDATAPFTHAARLAAVEMVQAWWAWNSKDENRVFPARDGSVTDVTARVELAAIVLTEIVSGYTIHVEAGRAFADREEKLNAESYRGYAAGVVVRKSRSFVNHLYTLPSLTVRADGDVAKACVGYNEETGAVTVSYADGVPPGAKTAREIVQDLWGAFAGGHDGIAGSPRDQRMTLEDAFRAAEAVAAELARSEVREALTG